MKLKIKGTDHDIDSVGDEVVLIRFEIEDDDGSIIENGMSYIALETDSDTKIENALKKILNQKKVLKEKKAKKTHKDFSYLHNREYTA